VRNLRDKDNPGATEYCIPHGAGFRFVSSPAYLAELIAWAGFALLTWSLAGVVLSREVRRLSGRSKGFDSLRYLRRHTVT